MLVHSGMLVIFLSLMIGIMLVVVVVVVVVVVNMHVLVYSGVLVLLHVLLLACVLVHVLAEVLVGVAVLVRLLAGGVACILTRLSFSRCLLYCSQHSRVEQFLQLDRAEGGWVHPGVAFNGGEKEPAADGQGNNWKSDNGNGHIENV